MDQKLFLTIFLGIWLGMTAYGATRYILRTIDYALGKRMGAKVQKLREINQKANKTGRVIGFRPIENGRA